MEQFGFAPGGRHGEREIQPRPAHVPIPLGYLVAQVEGVTEAEQQQLDALTKVGRALLAARGKIVDVASDVLDAISRADGVVLERATELEKHVRALDAAGATAKPVRRLSEIEAVDGLVIPGGESTTLWRLATAFELLDPVSKLIAGGLPVFEEVGQRAGTRRPDRRVGAEYRAVERVELLFRGLGAAGIVVEEHDQVTEDSQRAEALIAEVAQTRTEPLDAASRRVLTGSVEQLAFGLAGFADAGVETVVISAGSLSEMVSSPPSISRVTLALPPPPASFSTSILDAKVPCGQPSIAAKNG